MPLLVVAARSKPWANFYTPTKWLTADADFAWSDARFCDDGPVGNHIPGSIEGVVDARVAVHDLQGWLRGWSASVRLRYFSPAR